MKKFVFMLLSVLFIATNIVAAPSKAKVLTEDTIMVTDQVPIVAEAIVNGYNVTVFLDGDRSPTGYTLPELKEVCNDTDLVIKSDRVETSTYFLYSKFSFSLNYWKSYDTRICSYKDSYKSVSASVIKGPPGNGNLLLSKEWLIPLTT